MFSGLVVGVVVSLCLFSEDYVHRIGRTGRVGNAGRATSFFVPSEDGSLAPALCHSLGQAEQVISYRIDVIKFLIRL